MSDADDPTLGRLNIVSGVPEDYCAQFSPPLWPPTAPTVDTPQPKTRWLDDELEEAFQKLEEAVLSRQCRCTGWDRLAWADRRWDETKTKIVWVCPRCNKLRPQDSPNCTMREEGL